MWDRDAHEGSFAPEEFKDAYREELQAMIAAKSGREEVSAGIAPPAVTEPGADILEALKASIALARKPVVSEAGPQRKAGRVTEISTKRPARKAR